MSACADQELHLHSLLDGELDAVNALACEAHVKGCATCNAEILRLRALREAVAAPGVRYEPPAALRARIAGAAGAASDPVEARAPARRTVDRGRAVWAAGGVAGALAASVALAVALPELGAGGLDRQLVAGHVRSLLASHLIDVQTSSEHVVRPWFNGRIDFAPPVPELAAQGFPLAGGRLDYMEGRVVPAIVYRRRLHAINLFAWPLHGRAPRVRSVRLDGYSLVEWRQGDLQMAAVSDIGPDELRQFQDAFRKASSE